jgi:hypothetical protein
MPEWGEFIPGRFGPCECCTANIADHELHEYETELDMDSGYCIDCFNDMIEEMENE